MVVANMATKIFGVIKINIISLQPKELFEPLCKVKQTEVV